MGSRAGQLSALDVAAGNVERAPSGRAESGRGVNLRPRLSRSSPPDVGATRGRSPEYQFVAHGARSIATAVSSPAPAARILHAPAPTVESVDLRALSGPSWPGAPAPGPPRLGLFQHGARAIGQEGRSRRGGHDLDGAYNRAMTVCGPPAQPGSTSRTPRPLSQRQRTHEAKQTSSYRRRSKSNGGSAEYNRSPSGSARRPLWHNQLASALFRGLSTRRSRSRFRVTRMAYECRGWSLGGGLAMSSAGSRQAKRVADVFVPAFRERPGRDPSDGRADVEAWGGTCAALRARLGWGTSSQRGRAGGTRVRYEQRDVAIRGPPMAPPRVPPPGPPGRLHMPWELAPAPGRALPELRLEVDIAYQNWSPRGHRVTFSMDPMRGTGLTVRSANETP